MAKAITLAVAGIGLAGMVPLQAAPLPGAIFTTDSTCTGVNINIYSSKDDVYLDGGPAHPGAAALPDGQYYVMVTDPSGATLLGTSVGSGTDKPFVVVGGEPQACYQLSAILIKGSGLPGTVPGYDSTPNNGGEYKVWVSTVPTFDNNSTKTDNFKVKEDDSGPGGGPLTAELCVQKFYDANANGNLDVGESSIDGWQVLIADGISLIRFTPVCVTVEATNPGTQTPLYNVYEYPAVESNWIHTTGVKVEDLSLAPGSHTTIYFGNVCIGAGGGKTLGFWSNKNGQALMNDGGTVVPELKLVSSYNVRNANGTPCSPTNYTSFRTWLLGAKATNMAYMLSAQTAAMVLNVESGGVAGSALVHAPQLLPFAPVPGLNALGFISINNLLAAAKSELGAHGNAPSNSPFRSYQEALKNALDEANNDKTFVQAAPCPFSFEP